jgi:hypothetical protein
MASGLTAALEAVVNQMGDMAFKAPTGWDDGDDDGPVGDVLDDGASADSDPVAG